MKIRQAVLFAVEKVLEGLGEPEGVTLEDFDIFDLADRIVFFYKHITIEVADGAVGDDIGITGILRRGADRMMMRGQVARYASELTPRVDVFTVSEAP